MGVTPVTPSTVAEIILAEAGVSEGYDFAGAKQVDSKREPVAAVMRIGRRADTAAGAPNTGSAGR